ncbi:class I SAM-dependent methyltransferase [Mucilaginibacter gynuensis]|uniref:Class I SAM-dependent methyltransferase n=1 Tax=Mucilaginibacter gynuensis TaxID=1302236 RepID=A0ABP8G303_9SPHI
MKDILGQAIYDRYHKLSKHKLWIHNQYGPKEEMPVSTYFRKEDDLPDLEWHALNECRGKTLDIGAGAGSHSLELQNRGMDITALDISPLAVEVMRKRGLQQAIEADIFTYTGPKYDTLLLLMNGIGLTGSLENLANFLQYAKTLLAPGGQLLFDSSDIAYLYEGNPPQDRYYGEIKYQYEYKGKKTDWFNWLYVDEHTLTDVAKKTGWSTDILVDDEYGQYLARLQPIAE